MNDQKAAMGLGLKMDGHTHFADLTNLVASPCNNASGDTHELAMRHTEEGAFNPQDNAKTVHGTSYDSDSQEAIIGHSQAAPEFHDARIDGENMHPNMALYEPQGGLHAHDTVSDRSDVQYVCLKQAYEADVGYHSTVGQTANYSNPVIHPYLQTPNRGSESQVTSSPHLGHQGGQHADRITSEQAGISHLSNDLDLASGLQPHQLRAYLGSLPNRPPSLSESESRSLSKDTRAIGGRHASSHRPSHSLNQATAFISSAPPHDLLPQNQVSAPVSPASQGNHDPLFFHPEQRHDCGLYLAEDALSDRYSGLHGNARYSIVSTAPSVRSTSPSTSLGSTSMTSISPLGSARFNPDGSFTSQETSFDNWSNAVSRSFSRASSISEDVFSGSPGSLGLPSSRGTPKEKKRLRNIDRKMICDFAAAHPTVKQDAVAAKFGVERSTVSKILKHKAKWLSVEPGSEAARISKHRAVKFPAVEDRLSSWVAGLRVGTEGIRDSILRQQALRIARELGLGEDKFKASGGWIDKFRERNHIPKPPIDAIMAPAGSAESTRALKRSRGDDGSSLIGFDSDGLLDALSGSRTEAPSDTKPRPDRRSSARSGKSKAMSRERGRDDGGKSEVGLGVSPLSQDIARMPTQCMGPPGSMPNPVSFSSNVFMGPPSMPQPSPNYAIMSQGFGNVSMSSHITDVNEEESGRKRQRAIEVMKDTEVAMGLNAAFDFRFPPGAASAAPSPSPSPSPQLSLPGQAFQSLEQAIMTPQKIKARERRAAGRPSDANSRRGPCRSQGSLSIANHTPPTPSPLSMSPAAASEVANFPGLSAASTIVTLESSRALPSLGSHPNDVTAEQAKHSLDMVLRFLSKQPSEFLPRDHFAVFGNLRANIEEKVRTGTNDAAPAAAELQSPLPLQSNETTGEVMVPSLGEHVASSFMAHPASNSSCS